MKEINLYIMDMSSSSNTSGVDRYIENLLDGLIGFSFIKVHRIQLIWDSSLLFPKEICNENHVKMLIPMPQDSKKIINEQYWTNKYNAHLFALINHLFTDKEGCIIHIHTLNLIDLALYIRKRVSCKIITHLHCIPWKNYYNTNRKRFNELYEHSRLQEEELDGQRFLTNHIEYDSYRFPDAIICVTHNARRFIQNTLRISNNIFVVPNGIKDFVDAPLRRNSKDASEFFNILFVGNLSESKGVFFVLKALRKVQSSGYKVQLYIAGNCEDRTKKNILSEFCDISVHVLGRISFEELRMRYMQSDIGVIASLQEQCSYVAIEMAMFGLPVVTTAVDGLNEIFEDEVNALKVNTVFSKVFGLKVDVDLFAGRIIDLIESELLREQLGKNVRKRYEDKFMLERMILETIEIYKKLIDERE